MLLAKLGLPMCISGHNTHVTLYTWGKHYSVFVDNLLGVKLEHGKVSLTLFP